MPKPDGYTDVSPYLLVPDMQGAVRFLESVFGGTALRQMENADGIVSHAEVRIGDSIVMLGRAETPPGVLVHVYAKDPDEAHACALTAGATLLEAMEDRDDGERRGGFRDPWGISWFVSSSS